MLFVGPGSVAIMQAQRDPLVEDVVHLMERHLDGAELGGVVARKSTVVRPALRRPGAPAELGAAGRFGQRPWWRRRPRHLH